MSYDAFNDTGLAYLALQDECTNEHKRNRRYEQDRSHHSDRFKHLQDS
jgi:hypothetical protein